MVLSYVVVLGAGMQEITPELAKTFGLGNLDGVLVSEIVRHSPADQAGIKNGDVLLVIDELIVAGVADELVEVIGDGPDVLGDAPFVVVENADELLRGDCGSKAPRLQHDADSKNPQRNLDSLDFVGVDDFDDSFPDGETAAQPEQNQGHDETPEIALSVIAELMLVVGRFLGLLAAEKEAAPGLTCRQPSGWLRPALRMIWLGRSRQIWPLRCRRWRSLPPLLPLRNHPLP